MAWRGNVPSSLVVPPTVRYEFVGQRPPGLMAKDVILYLLGQFSSGFQMFFTPKRFAVSGMSCIRPRAPQYARLMHVLGRLNQIRANGGWPGVPAGGAGALICFLTVEKARSSRGTLGGADHTAADSLPPGTSSRLIPVRAAGRFGRNIRPHLERTALNVDFGKSRTSASLSLNSITPSRPSDLALAFAIASICGEMSVATTLPLGLTRLAAVIAGSPIPVAMSRTLSPGLISASSTILSLTLCAPCSKVDHQACQPAATPEPTEAATPEVVEEPTEVVEEPTEAVEEPTEAVEEPTEAVEEPTEAVVEPSEVIFYSTQFNIVEEAAKFRDILAEGGFDGARLRLIIERGARAMGVDIAQVVDICPCRIERHAHGSRSAFAVLLRRGHMERVGSGAVACELGQDIRATRPCLRLGFQHQHRGAFAHHQSIAVPVEGLRCHRIITVTP